jgi:hypothetical protein
VDDEDFTQPSGENTPGDWDLAEAVSYRNDATAPDGSDEAGGKRQEINLKVFGSFENRAKGWAKLRDSNPETVAARLVRELNINPAPAQ